MASSSPAQWNTAAPADSSASSRASSQAPEPPASHGAWTIGTIAGIRIRVHATFLLLLGWVAVMHVMQGQGLLEIASGLAFVIAVFAIVVLHELGHALTARHFGIRTRDITLLPIGGVARLERMPENPRQEMLVAAAGPAVNVVLALLAFAVVALAHAPLAPAAVHVVGGPFVTKLAWVNVSLAAFNMLPAFPMDGGRVMRAALATRLDYVRATAIAARLGRGMALLLGLAGLLANPFLVFIAFFVWVGAQEEASSVQVRSALSGVPVRHAMITRFYVLSPYDAVARAVELSLSGFQGDFPVVDGDAVVGILTRDDVMRALASDGPPRWVGDVMQRRFAVADGEEVLDVVLPRLQGSGVRMLPVLEGGRLVGLLTLENVGELVVVREAARLHAGPWISR